MATTVNTLETDTEVFKGDRVVADGVERELGDVTISGTSLVSSTDPFGDGSLVAKYEFENDTTDLLGGASAAWVGTSSYSATSLGLGAEFNGASRIDIVASNMKSVNLKFILYDVSQDTETYLLDTRSGTGTTWVITHADDSKIYFLNCAVKIDGVNVADGEFTITKGVEYSMYVELDTIADTATVGANFASSATTFTRGIEDQVEIYNRALTDTEVNTLYTQSIPKYSADFNTPLASIPTSVYRLDHDNLTILRQSNDSLLDDANLIAHYKFDGDATDRKGVYDGTLASGSYVTGEYGQGVNITTAGGITLPSMVAEGLTDGYSVSMWINRNSFVTDQLFLTLYNGAYIQIASTGATTMTAGHYSGSAWYRPTITGVPNTSIWFNLTLTYDGTTIKTYLNAVANGTLSAPNSANGGLTSRIGANTDGNLPCNSVIDQVRIFNRALTAGEVESLYNDGTPTDTTATVSDSRTGLIASGDTVLLDGVGVVCNPVVETEVGGLEPDGSLNTSTTDAVPKMTSNTTSNTSPSGVAFSSTPYTGREAYFMFDDSTTSKFESNAATIYLGYKFSTSKIINKFSIHEQYINADSATITAFNFQGSNNTTTGADGTWTTIKSFTGQTLTDDVVNYFYCTNSTAYTAYKIVVTAKTGGDYCEIAELELIEAEGSTEYQYDLTYPTQTAPTRIALSNNDIVPTVASDEFDGTDTFTKTYNKVTKTARDVEYGFVADDEVEIVQFNLNQNMEP